MIAPVGVGTDIKNPCSCLSPRKRGSYRGAAARVFCFCASRSPRDRESLHGRIGEKHRRDFTRLPAERRVCERPHKIPGTWVGQPGIDESQPQGALVSSEMGGAR
jgi:hypothetical protein